MDGILFAIVFMSFVLTLKPLDVLLSSKKEEPHKPVVNILLTLLLFAVFSAIGKTDISTYIGCILILLCALVQFLAIIKAMVYRPYNKRLSN